MNWEAVAAVSTAFTGLVILATALAAVREVRIAAEHSRSTRDQLEHLRKATQFEGALAVFSELDTPLQMQARHFVQFELEHRMKDEGFRKEVALAGPAFWQSYERLYDECKAWMRKHHVHVDDLERQQTLRYTDLPLA